MISNVSPVWNAKQSGGMVTLVVRELREWIYRPARGSGDEGRVASGERRVFDSGGVLTVVQGRSGGDADSLM